MLCIRRLHGVEYNHEFYLKKQKRKIYYDTIIINCSRLLFLYSMEYELVYGFSGMANFSKLD